MTDTPKSTGHFERCRARVLARARELANAVNRGSINRSACDGLISSFLDQPAYYAELRPGLLIEALEVIDG